MPGAKRPAPQGVRLQEVKQLERTYTDSLKLLVADWERCHVEVRRQLNQFIAAGLHDDGFTLDRARRAHQGHGEASAEVEAPNRAPRTPPPIAANSSAKKANSDHGRAGTPTQSTAKSGIEDNESFAETIGRLNDGLDDILRVLEEAYGSFEGTAMSPALLSDERLYEAWLEKQRRKLSEGEATQWTDDMLDVFDEVRFRVCNKYRKDLLRLTSLVPSTKSTAGSQSARTAAVDHVIAPQGDTILEFATRGLPAVRFRVSSHVLAESSPYFARLFSPGQDTATTGGTTTTTTLEEEDPFDAADAAEGIFTSRLPAHPPTSVLLDDGSRARLYRMPSPEPSAFRLRRASSSYSSSPATAAAANNAAGDEDDHHRHHLAAEAEADRWAVGVFLHAAHHRSAEVPREVRFAQFVRVAEVCSRYRCTAPLEVMVEHVWMPAWMHRAARQEGVPEGFLVICYVFGMRRLFTRVSKTAVLNLEGREQLRDMRWPWRVKERVWRVRNTKMAQLLRCCADALAEYLPPQPTPVFLSDSPDVPPAPETLARRRATFKVADSDVKDGDDIAAPPSTLVLALPAMKPRCRRRVHACDAANLGSLMLEFNALGLLPYILPLTSATTAVPPSASSPGSSTSARTRSVPTSPPAPPQIPDELPPVPLARLVEALHRIPSPPSTEHLHPPLLPPPRSSLASSVSPGGGGTNRLSLIASITRDSNNNSSSSSSHNRPAETMAAISETGVVPADAAGSSTGTVSSISSACDPSPALRRAVSDVYNSVTGLTLGELFGLGKRSSVGLPPLVKTAAVAPPPARKTTAVAALKEADRAWGVAGGAGAAAQWQGSAAAAAGLGLLRRTTSDGNWPLSDGQLTPGTESGASTTDASAKGKGVLKEDEETEAEGSQSGVLAKDTNEMRPADVDNGRESGVVSTPGTPQVQSPSTGNHDFRKSFTRRSFTRSSTGSMVPPPRAGGSGQSRWSDSIGSPRGNTRVKDFFKRPNSTGSEAAGPAFQDGGQPLPRPSTRSESRLQIAPQPRHVHEEFVEDPAGTKFLAKDFFISSPKTLSAPGQKQLRIDHDQRLGLDSAVVEEEDAAEMAGWI